MLEVAHPNCDDPGDDINSTTHNEKPPSQRKKPKILLPYATKVVEDDPTDDCSTPKTTTSWPISPTAEKVGEFKVSPSVHVGYAITWYGLSMAGLYMTRMLLFKR